MRVITIFVLLNLTLLAQGEKINQQKSKLTDLRKEIQILENELNDISKNEKASVELLNKINQQILFYNKVVVKLRNEEKQKEEKIHQLEDSIKIINSNIFKLKNEYSKYVRWLYMFGREEQLYFIITSKSISQAFSRYKYFNYITRKNQSTIKKLETNKAIKLLLSEKYKSEVIEKNKLLAEKESEQKLLKIKKEQKSYLLSQLRKDKKNIFQEIDNKQKAEIRIKDLIAKLEKEETERKQKILEAEMKSKIPVSKKEIKYNSFKNFGDMAGKLKWPVASGVIVRNFGENKNEQLNTVTLNYGIDIKAKTDEDVRSIADGIVSAIEWIPGYGSVVILTHSEDYRTVYGHITDLQVDEGTEIKDGDVIGKISDSLEGKILHFEIWNKRVYQNPEEWLVRR